MYNKSESNKGDGIIIGIDLKSGRYKETTLVDKMCTEAFKKSYHKKARFPNSKARDTFLDRLACYCKYEPVPNTDKYNIRVFEHPKQRQKQRYIKEFTSILLP